MNLPKRKRQLSNPPNGSSAPRPVSRAFAKVIRVKAAALSGVLKTQPISLAGINVNDRRKIVVSAIRDDQGCEHIQSRWADSTWNLSSIWRTQNTKHSERQIAWDTSLPDLLLEDAKAILYKHWRCGRDGEQLPSPRTIATYSDTAQVTLRWLAVRGCRSFGDITPDHVLNLVNELRSSVSRGRIYARLWVLDAAREFQDELLTPLAFDPWHGKTLNAFLGPGGQSDEPAISGARALTPIIPKDVQSTLFTSAEAALQESDKLLLMRDRGEILANDPRLIRVRDAVLYLTQITTGMRNSEATGIKVGCWRLDRIGSETIHWVSAVEHKGGHGLVDFLAPVETIAALNVAARVAEPFQARLLQEQTSLEARLKDEAVPGGVRLALLQRLQVVREAIGSVFLGLNKYASDGLGTATRVEVMTREACTFAMRRLASHAGVTWPLTNMQCRRTFAWTVANSSLGRHGLVFIKWQLKHARMRLSEIYGANPRQDPSLYHEFIEERTGSQEELVASWFDNNAALSGGAGRKILEARAIAVKDRASLLRHAAASLTIRSTGHSWCLSEQKGCVGTGIYEAYRCTSCGSGVIDRSQAGMWQEIHLHNLALAKIKDSVPAVSQRAQREIAASEKVLKELGVQIPAGARK